MDRLNSALPEDGLSSILLIMRVRSRLGHDRPAKDALYDALAGVAKALGSGRRAELVDVLAQGERSVEDLAREIDQSLANTSQHLQQLLRAGLVHTRREGTRIFYSLASPRVTELWLAVREIAAGHVAELDRLASDYLGDRSDLQTVSREELSRRVQAGDVVVLDVRPRPEYHAGHIAGARSLPLSDLRRRLRELPKDVDIVAYCRGPYCVYADEAVRRLSRSGRRAARLEDGYPEWARAGLPVTAAS
jgi:rhodanese-related sulfurtransferase/DNA-binding MarR family transcriptional regulator